MALTPSVFLVAFLAGGDGLPAPSPNPPAVEALDRTLRATVRDGLVDYLTLRFEHRSGLTTFLDAAATFDPDRLPDESRRLAYLVDLYNATVLDQVCRRLRAGYSVSEGDFALFHEPVVRVAGRRLSLDELEHGWIRKRFAEPRVHFALVCAARSCPPLASFAYQTVDDLDAVLEERMRRFLRDERFNRIDRDARRLRLSRIFDWYAEDFGGREGIAAFVGRALGEDFGGYEVDFLPYEWSLNVRPPEDRSGRAVVRPLADPPLAKGEIVRSLGSAGEGRVRVEIFGRGEAVVPADALEPWP